MTSRPDPFLYHPLIAYRGKVHDVRLASHPDLPHQLGELHLLCFVSFADELQPGRRGVSDCERCREDEGLTLL